MVETIIWDFGNVVAFFDHQRAIQQLIRYSPLEPTALYQAIYETPTLDAYEQGLISTPEFVSWACSVGQLNCTPR